MYGHVYRHSKRLKVAWTAYTSLCPMQHSARAHRGFGGLQCQVGAPDDFEMPEKRTAR